MYVFASGSGAIKMTTGELAFEGATRIGSPGDGRYRLSLRAPQPRVRQIEPGDRIVITARNNETNGSAVVLRSSQRCVVEGCTIHSSPLLAFLVPRGDRLVFTDCAVEPPMGSGRLLSSVADGMHCYDNRQGPLIERCRFVGTGDDALTFHNKPGRVYAAPESNTVLV